MPGWVESKSEAVFEYLRSLGNADLVTPVPLAEDEKKTICGTYRLSDDPTQRIDVSADVRAYEGTPMYTHPPQLNWTRIGTMARPLFHLGHNVFYPVGAPSIQIRFEERMRVVNMTVADGEDILLASRAQGA